LLFNSTIYIFITIIISLLRAIKVVKCKVCNGRMIDTGSTQVRHLRVVSNVWLCSYGGGCSVRHETNPWGASSAMWAFSTLKRMGRTSGCSRVVPPLPFSGMCGRAIKAVRQRLGGLASSRAAPWRSIYLGRALTIFGYRNH
jgi:hypothetical protein